MYKSAIYIYNTKDPFHMTLNILIDYSHVNNQLKYDSLPEFVLHQGNECKDFIRKHQLKRVAAKLQRLAVLPLGIDKRHRFGSRKIRIVFAE